MNQRSKKQKGKLNAGVITLELLIALVIIIVSVTTVILLVFGSQNTTVATITNQEALYKAQEQIEIARATARANFSDPTLDPGTQSSSDVSGITYSKNLTVSTVDEFTKKITSLVNWPSGSISLLTLLTDWKADGNTCKQSLSGDWSNPVHYDFASDKDLFPSGSSNGLSISDIKVYKGRLYLTASNTANNGATFYIFSLPANPSVVPTYLGSIDNAGSVGAGLNAVVIHNDWAYVANSYAGSNMTCTEAANCAEVQVINVNDPSSLAIAKNIKISAFTSNNKLPEGKALYYYKGYLYVGLAKVADTSTYGEFNIIDVGGGGASPTTPSPKGTYKVGSGINAIWIKGKYAYLAHPSPTSALYPQEQLTILDISNPESPSRISGFFYDGASGGNGKSLYFSGNDLFLGRTATKLSGANDSIPEFFMFDNSNPPGISNTGSLPLSQTGDSINGLAVKENLAFFITNKEFQIWDISNPGNITLFKSLSLGDFTQGAGVGTGNALNCSSDYFYVGITSLQGNNKDILSIIAPHN